MALVPLLAGCATGTPVESASVQSVGATCISRVTPDCSEYSYDHTGPGTVVVSAPPTGASNNREFFWAPSGPERPDLTVCATFASGAGFDQQGVVLRLGLLPHDRVTGVTVTRNVWLGAFDVFNFHTWDTATDPASPFTMFGSTVVRPLPVAPATYPLHLCARTVPATRLVQFVVWTTGQARPAWGDPVWGGQATLPPGAPASGRGGWFAGHLRPGTSRTYTDLTVDGGVPDRLP